MRGESSARLHALQQLGREKLSQWKLLPTSIERRLGSSIVEGHMTLESHDSGWISLGAAPAADLAPLVPPTPLKISTVASGGCSEAQGGQHRKHICHPTSATSSPLANCGGKCCAEWHKGGGNGMEAAGEGGTGVGNAWVGAGLVEKAPTYPVLSARPRSPTLDLHQQNNCSYLVLGMV